jgi:hypothetical protein
MHQSIKDDEAQLQLVKVWPTQVAGRQWTTSQVRVRQGQDYREHP